MEKPSKMDDLEVPLFWKHPYENMGRDREASVDESSSAKLDAKAGTGTANRGGGAKWSFAKQHDRCFCFFLVVSLQMYLFFYSPHGVYYSLQV